MRGEAFEVDGPEGERDEEPIVDVPDEAGFGFGKGRDAGGEGVEFFDERAAMGATTEGELVEATKIGRERARHSGGILA